MKTIDDIRAVVADDMRRFQRVFDSSFETDNGLLRQVFQLVKETTGKQLRPLLTVLAARMTGEPTDVTYNVARVLELLHTCSLLHDDVVDEASVRRGRPSVNAVYGNKVAVLSGDYVLARVFDLVSEMANRRVSRALARLGMDLSEGEILELKQTGNLRLTQGQYVEILRKKTAILFSTSMEAGALTSSSFTETQAEKLRAFGDLLGLCFQIKDDIFDYERSEERIGKPIGNDVRERKVTQPLICALGVASEEEKRKMEALFQQSSLPDDDVRQVIDFVRSHDGISAAYRIMEEYQKQALTLLEAFPDSVYKTSVIDALDFVLRRDK
ncbi:MAG: polyprenyl synthetase family protein [Paludibacteraceae bacterium]|nr:polyprenyl synthetase family protein [Paludibacteraceae bacterium]